MTKTKSLKLKYNDIKAKLNNRGMRKVINKKVRGEFQPNKENWSPLRKALNELDPNFDNYIRMISKVPNSKVRELQVQLKAKEKKDKEK